MLLMVIYSHSRLSSFEQCPYKFKLRYIDKIIPEIEKSIEAHLGSSVHDALEWLYQSVIEDRILIKLDEEFQIQGFIDRLVHNTKTNIIEIHDYKTANSLPPQEKFETDRQLALYSIAIKEKFGNDKKVLLVWHYLAHNTKIISTRTNEQLKQLKQETLKLIKEIESTTKFPSKKSILCDWCEYKSMCPEFGGIVGERQKKL